MDPPIGPHPNHEDCDKIECTISKVAFDKGTAFLGICFLKRFYKLLFYKFLRKIRRPLWPYPIPWDHYFMRLQYILPVKIAPPPQLWLQPVI